MKYLCVKSIKNKEAIKDGELIWHESFTKGRLYEYYGKGVVRNNFGEPHDVSWWFKFRHFSKLSKKQELASDIYDDLQKLQYAIVGCNIDEDKFNDISRLLSDAYVRATVLKIELDYLW
jgi:hypothetical protein